MRCLALLCILIALPAAADTLRVAVAANFRPALERINAAFEQASGHRVLLSSAATGTLYSQIRHGAPFDLFLAADRDTPAALERDGEAAAGSRFCYAVGRLVLAGGSGDLAQLADPALGLAIANPDIAPYGRAAVEVLARPEFAAGAGRRLVRGANAAQAYQFWYSGGVELALLPASLAPAGIPVPAAWHAPLEQHAVVLRGAAGRPAVAAYLNWLRSDTVERLIRDAGYDPCP